MEHEILLGLLIFSAVVGLVLGPGYVLYCVYFSGRLITASVVFKRHGTEPNPACIPIKLRLSPDMNPIEVRYVVRYQPSELDLPGERFRLRLAPPDAGNPLWACEAPKATMDDAGRSYFGRVSRFSVVEAGQYRIDVERQTQPALPAARVKLDVRRNVKNMKSSVALGGMFILVGSLIAAPIVTPPTLIQENASGAANANPTTMTATSPNAATTGRENNAAARAEPVVRQGTPTTQATSPASDGPSR